MISTGELRKGVVIELDGDLWQILDYHHIKMGRGSAQVRIKLRNVKKGSTVERVVPGRASAGRAPRSTAARSSSCTATATTSTSWRPRPTSSSCLRAETLDDAVDYLKDGMTVDRTSYQGDTIGIELPVTVDLRVAETEPGFAGDTAHGRPQERDHWRPASSSRCRCSSTRATRSASTPAPASTRPGSEPAGGTLTAGPA